MPEPIPKVCYGQLVGLLEILDDLDGKADLARIARDILLELDDLLPAVEAGELLGFLTVDSGDVSLTNEGKKFVHASIRRRKEIIRAALLNLDLFKRVVAFIEKTPERVVERQALQNFLEQICVGLPPEATLRWVIEWGRHGLILRYDSEQELVCLAAPRKSVV